MRYRTLVYALFAAVAALALASKEASAVEVTEPAPLPPPLAGKVTGAWAKADTALRRLVAEFRAHQEHGVPGPFGPSNTTLQYSRGRIVITAVAAGDPEVLLEDLRRLGLQKSARYGSVVSGLLPIGVIGQAVRLESLRSVAASRKPLTNVGDVTSDGVEAMYADLVHNDGLIGAGVTVGVLSDSYDQQGGAADDQASDDLPADVTVLDDSANCGNPCGDEGRAMMQLIYDVAPGSNFAFHTAFGGMADFAIGIEQLAAAGSHIIVDDVFYFAEPMFQDGIVARAVDNVVSQGVAYFSSAGNFARESYEAAYVASGEPLFVNGEPRGELHDFDPEATTDWAQSFTIPDLPDSTIVTLVLQWDEPFASVSMGRRGSSSDVDIYLVNADNSIVLASSIDDNIASGEPIEIFQFMVPPCDFILFLFFGISCVQDPGTYNLVITLFDGPAPGKLKYIIFRHDIEVEYPTHSSTLYGHANAAGAETVGAAFYQATPAFCNNGDSVTYNDCGQADGVSTAMLEIFSAAGGTATLFKNNGLRLDPPEFRKKPEVVGPDGTNTTFFFADTSRDLDDWPNFFGTSASAPHVAGVGALMLQANPALSPGDIYAALEGTALNMNPRAEGPPEDLDGFDFDTGYGFVQADLAVDAVATTGSGNSAPVANNDSASTKAGTAVVIDVLANDTDPDGDSLSIAAVVGGSVTINVVDNTVTYEPLSGFTGTDSFKYQASDGALVSNQATVSVNVKKGKGGGGDKGGGKPCNPKKETC